MQPRRGIHLVAVALLIGGCGGPGASLESGNVTVITGARLIDGTVAPVVENAVLVIRGERFEYVGAAGSIDVPPDARVLDFTGKTIIPPIINLHGHLARTIGLDASATHYTEENVRDKLNRYAQYGVLHVLSIGIDQPLVFDVRRRQREGRFPGARIYTAGRGFGVEGGYPPPVPDERDGQGAFRPADPAAARDAVRELARDEVDFVKIWLDDQFGSLPALDPAIYNAVIDEARRHGLRTGAHVFTLDSAHRIVDAGIHGLLHSVRDLPVDDELLEKMKRRGVFSISTLVREESAFIYAQRPPYLDDPFFTSRHSRSITDVLGSEEYQAGQRANPNLDRWKSALRMAQRNLMTMYNAGVKVGFGSDSGPPGRFEGYFEHREMELMVEAGLTPAQVIEIASKNSAEILGIDRDYGTLEASKMAEFLVLAANPLDDISNTKQLEQVWQDGVRIH